MRGKGARDGGYRNWRREEEYQGGDGDEEDLRMPKVDNRRKNTGQRESYKDFKKKNDWDPNKLLNLIKPGGITKTAGTSFKGSSRLDQDQISTQPRLSRCPGKLYKQEYKQDLESLNKQLEQYYKQQSNHSQSKHIKSKRQPNNKQLAPQIEIQEQTSFNDTSMWSEIHHNQIKDKQQQVKEQTQSMVMVKDSFKNGNMQNRSIDGIVMMDDSWDIGPTVKNEQRNFGPRTRNYRQGQEQPLNRRENERNRQIIVRKQYPKRQQQKIMQNKSNQQPQLQAQNISFDIPKQISNSANKSFTKLIDGNNSDQQYQNNDNKQLQKSLMTDQQLSQKMRSIVDKKWVSIVIKFQAEDNIIEFKVQEIELSIPGVRIKIHSDGRMEFKKYPQISQDELKSIIVLKDFSDLLPQHSKYKPLMNPHAVQGDQQPSKIISRTSLQLCRVRAPQQLIERHEVIFVRVVVVRCGDCHKLNKIVVPSDGSVYGSCFNCSAGINGQIVEVQIVEIKQ